MLVGGRALPDARRPCRAQRQLRHERGAARRAGRASATTARTRPRCARAPAWASRSRASSSRTASRSSQGATPTSTRSAAPRSTSASSSGCSHDRLRVGGHRLPPRVPRPDRVHDARLHDLRGDVREPRAHALAGPRAVARGAAGRAPCTCSASTRSRMARSSRARATSTRSTRRAGACCGGRATRARCRCGTRRAGPASARRWCTWASAPTATSWASASASDPSFSNPGLHAPRRARAAAPGRAARGFVAAENLTDAQYQEVLGYPALGRALRGRRHGSACGRP